MLSIKIYAYHMRSITRKSVVYKGPSLMSQNQLRKTPVKPRKPRTRKVYASPTDPGVMHHLKKMFR
jgi:hypothetical protein